MNQLIRRRKLLACGLVSGLAGFAGCLRKQEPKASHWAAGIGWSESTGKVFAETGFVPRDAGQPNPRRYFRINHGELQPRYSSSIDNAVPADRGDHVEIVTDFDTLRQGKETVFEYTIPDDPDLVAVLAGFAECHHYRNTDEWVVRPLNVDLDTDLLARQQETLVVQVEREYRDERPDWFVWGHDETIRAALRDRAAESDRDPDIEFLDSGEEAMFGPAAFHRVRIEITDGAERVARVSYPEPDAEP